MSPSLKEQAEAAMREPKAPDELHVVAQTGKAPEDPKPDTRRLNLWIDRGIHRQLKRRAADEDVSMKDLIERALIEAYGFEPGKPSKP